MTTEQYSPMLREPFMKLTLNPQKFNLDKFGFTFIVTADEVADALLDLKPRQLKAILKKIEANSDIIICEAQSLPKKHHRTYDNRPTK